MTTLTVSEAWIVLLECVDGSLHSHEEGVGADVSSKEVTVSTVTQAIQFQTL